MRIIKSTFVMTMLTIAMTALFGCVSVDANGRDFFSGRESIKPSGKIVSKTFKVAPVNSISVTSIVDVVVTQGNTQKIVVKGSDNLIPYCEIKNNDGKLTVGMTKEARSKSFPKCDLIVYVTVKDINNVSSSGTGDVKFQGSVKSQILRLSVSGTGDISVPVFNGDRLKVSISGTGDVLIGGNVNNATLSVSGTGDINAKLSELTHLSASVSGTGDIELKGKTSSATYSVSGTGEIYARKMIARNVEATASGTGDITCYASDSFTGRRSGIADITCYGKPKNRNLKTKGYSFPDEY